MKKLKTNALMTRHSGKLGYTQAANRPVMIPKGTLYEHVRLIDKQHSYVRINNLVYVAKNKDLTLREQVVQSTYPQQAADFAPVSQKNVSLDQVIDRYIVRYERESIPETGMPGPGPTPAATTAPETLAASPATLEEHQLRTLMTLLSEQDVPPLPGADDAPPDDEPAGDEGGGGGGPTPEGPPVVNTPKINLNDFTRSMARLINNYDALLNPRSIILNRAEAYIKSNYDERTAKMFMQIMERNYGLHPTNTEYTSTRSEGEYPTPYSANAGGQPEQLAGGGGGPSGD
jgi:hypothetical protein